MTMGRARVSAGALDTPAGRARAGGRDRLVGERGSDIRNRAGCSSCGGRRSGSLGAGVADRPFAHRVVQRHQRDVEADRHDDVLDRHRRRQPPRRRLGVRLQRGVADDEGAREGGAASRPHLARGRGALEAGFARPERLRRCTLPMTALRRHPAELRRRSGWRSARRSRVSSATRRVRRSRTCRIHPVACDQNSESLSSRRR